MPIEKGLIGYQDLALGTSTFQRKSQSGQLITLDQIRASHVPILDSAGRFTGTDIEAALAETMTREESGSTVKKLTNRSGAQRVAGDVVIIDTSNDDSFTTTTTVGNVLVLGVVLETIANLATGRVATGGYVASVKVTGATVRGQYLLTSTTAVKADPTSTLTTGCFAVALSNSASSVSAFVFGVSPTNITGTATNATTHNNINIKVVNIGDWNMDTTAAVSVAHGLTITSIRAVFGLLRNDADDNYFTITPAYEAVTSLHVRIQSITASDVTLTRLAGGGFDSVSFDSTSYNRGWLTIWYV